MDRGVPKAWCLPSLYQSCGCRVCSKDNRSILCLTRMFVGSSMPKSSPNGSIYTFVESEDFFRRERYYDNSSVT